MCEKKNGYVPKGGMYDTGGQNRNTRINTTRYLMNTKRKIGLQFMTNRWNNWTCDIHFATQLLHWPYEIRCEQNMGDKIKNSESNVWPLRLLYDRSPQCIRYISIFLFFCLFVLPRCRYVGCRHNNMLAWSEQRLTRIHTTLFQFLVQSVSVSQ